MANFIIQFSLKTERYQEDILNKRFEIGRKIYNSLVNITQKCYREMIKTKEYRKFLVTLKNDNKKEKTVWKKINDIRKQYGMSEYSFHNNIKNIQKHFKENIDAFTAQKIASELWKSYQKFFYGNGKKVYYKRYGELNSLEGKNNKTSIRIKEDMLYWNGLKIPVMIDYNNDYEYHAMKCDICYCRIVRKYIRKKYKFYLQIVLKGNPPTKMDKTGKSKRCLGNGDVGLDIGTQTIAISSQSEVKLLELADNVQNIENKKQKLLRKMDRSRRKTNPNHYNKNGTMKKQRGEIWKNQSII